MTESQLTLVIGSGVTILAVLVGFFLNVLYENYRERRKTLNEGLRKHFTDLEESFIKPMIGGLERIRNSNGHFYIFIPERQFEVELNESKEWTSIKTDREGQHIFKLHFPKYKTLELLDRIEEHNEIYRGLKRRLRQKIEDRCKILVRDSGEMPFIEPSAVDELFDSVCNKVKQRPVINNFLQAELIKYTHSDPPHWMLKTKRGVLGRFRDETEGRFTQTNLIELQESNEVEKEIQTLLKDTEQLENEIDSIYTRLKSICQYGKFGEPLKRNRNCTICQVIFK